MVCHIFKLDFVILNIVILNVVILNVIILNVVMLNAVILNVDFYENVNSFNLFFGQVSIL